MSKKHIIHALLACAVSATALTGCDDKGGDKKAAADGKDGGDSKEAAKADGGEEAKADGGEEAKADGGEAAAGGDVTLVGSWSLDIESMKDSDEYKNAPEDQKKMMDAMLGSMELTMTFGEDTVKMSTKFGGESKEQEGKYTIKSSEGNKITIEGDMDGKKEELTFEIDGDKMTTEDDGKKMVFKRG